MIMISTTQRSINMSSSGCVGLDTNQRLDNDTDSRGSQSNDSGNELSMGSSEGGSHHRGHNLTPDNQQNVNPDDVTSNQFTSLSSFINNDASFSAVSNNFNGASLFDTPQSMLKSPEYDMFSTEGFNNSTNLSPFNCNRCKKICQNGVQQFSCTHKTCTSCLQMSIFQTSRIMACSICGSTGSNDVKIQQPQMFLTPTSNASGAYSMETSTPNKSFDMLESSMNLPSAKFFDMNSRINAGAQQAFNFSVPPSNNQSLLTSIASPNAMSDQATVWSPIMPPHLMRQAQNSPLLHSNFDSLTVADDAPLFSPLSPTNTSNIGMNISYESPQNLSAVAPPRNVQQNVTNHQPKPVKSQNEIMYSIPLIPCQGCSDKKDATDFCIQCKDMLCQNCVNAHLRVRTTKNHKVIPLNQMFHKFLQQNESMQQEKYVNQNVLQNRGSSISSAVDCVASLGGPESGESSPRSSSVCSVHEARFVGICDHCPHSVPLCAVCVAQHTSKHRVQPLSDIRRALNDFANESKSLDWQCEKMCDTIKNMIDGVMTNAATAENEITTTIDKFIRTFEERKKDLLRRVETMKNMKITSLMEQNDKLSVKKRELQQAIMNAKAKAADETVDNEQLRSVFETLAACQMSGNALTSDGGQNDELNNNMNMLMLACEVNEDDRITFVTSQDPNLLKKVKSFGSVESGPCAKTSSIIGEGDKRAIRDRQSVVYVQLRDACGESLTSLPAPPAKGNEKKSSVADVHAYVLSPDGYHVKSSITPREKGIVAVTYLPVVEGVHTLNILIKGISINGCPLKFNVRRGRNYEEISKKGPLFSFGREGNGDGELCRPWGICVDARGRVLVADRSNNRIQIFDKDGNYLAKFGTSGNRPGQFDRPAGITTNTHNHIVVADKDNHRIQVFDEDGNFLLKFGDRGRGVNYFNYPWGVATNSHNVIAVSDTRNHRVQIFTAQGQFIRKCGFDSAYFFKNLDSPRGLCYLPDGQLLITDFNNHRIAVLSPTNMYEMKVYGSEGDSDGMFVRPQGVKIDQEGNILVCDSRNNRIQVFSSDDMRFIGAFGLSPAPSGFQMPAELPAPYASVSGPFGGPTFSSTPTPITPSPRQLLDRPTDLAVGPDGRIYVVDFGNNCIRVF